VVDGLQICNGTNEYSVDRQAEGGTGLSNNRSKIVNCQPICCNLCGSEESAPLFEGRDRLHGLKGRFTYVRCRQCSLIYMNPQIMPEELGRYYTSGYVPHRLKSDKKSNRSGLNLRRLPHLQYLCSILTEQSRVLDVGCGNGTFLHQVKSLKGCQVEGVDISEAAARTAEENYELKIFVGPVSDAPFLNGYFDVITAWSFLEHVNDPSLVLAKVSDLLKEDGVFLVSTPNFESFNAKLFKDKWYHLDCPRHLYIYTITYDIFRTILLDV